MENWLCNQLFTNLRRLYFAIKKIRHDFSCLPIVVFRFFTKTKQLFAADRWQRQYNIRTSIEFASLFYFYLFLCLGTVISFFFLMFKRLLSWYLNQIKKWTCSYHFMGKQQITLVKIILSYSTYRWNKKKRQYSLFPNVIFLIKPWKSLSFILANLRYLSLGY